MVTSNRLIALLSVMWRQITSIFVQIPATFWGVVVGSLFTLGGITLTNRHSTRNLRIQLEHDRTQRNRQREMDLRKEVYLQASAAVSTGLYAIGRLSDLNLPIQDAIRAFTDRAPDVAKVNVIAGERAIRSIGALLMQLNSAFMDLEARRLPGSHIKALLDGVQRQLDRHLSDQTRSIEMMKEENYRGRPDQVKWDAIQHNYQFETEQIAKLLKEQGELKSKMLNEQLAVSTRSVELLGMLHRSLPPALAAVRGELDIEEMEDALASFFDELSRKAAADFDAVVAAVRSHVHNLTQAQAAEDTQTERDREELPAAGENPEPAKAANVAANSSAGISQNQVQAQLSAERARAALWEYRYLNLFLARNTQTVLEWFASLQNPSTFSLFDTVWLPRIPNPAERQAVITALRAHWLIVDGGGETFSISDKGREYLQWRGPLPALPSNS